MTAFPARPVQLLRGLAALLTLVLIVVGTPALLLTVAPLPLPSGLPTLDEVTTTLTSRDDGTLFIRAVALVAWGAWAVFTTGVLVEMAAQAGGRQAPRLPGMGSLQRTAAKLVAAVLVAVGVGAPAAMAATPPVAAPTAPHTAPPGPADVPAAENRLGQPVRSPAPPEGHTRIVDRGDTLWGIAEDEYGDGDRYPAIFKASKDIDQPDGVPRLTDPDRIYPGARLIIPKTGKPTDPAPPQKKPPQKKPPHKQPGSSPSAERPPQTPPPATQQPTTPPPSSPAPAEAGRAGGPAASPASPTPTGNGQRSAKPAAPDIRTGDDGGEREESSVSARTVLGYSALAAAGLLALLALKRLVQQRRRRPGQRIRVPETMSDSEMDMRAQQEPASVELLDTALRSLSLRLGRTGGTLPVLRGAHVTGETVELLLAEPAAPVPPFVTGSTDRLWKLDRDSEALLDPDDLQDVPSPYPSLVTVGFDRAFTHVLIDLEAAGAVTLTGGDRHVHEVLSAFALEMAISPWADHIVITCVAFGAELPRVFGTGRLRYAETVDEALRDFEARAREVSEVLADARIGSVRQARTEQVADDSWTPQVILSSVPFGAEEVIRLRALVERDGADNLAAVIAAGDGSGPELPGHWTLDTTPDRTVDIDPFGPVTIQRITSDQYRQLVSDLSMANDETGVPHPDWQDVPPEPGEDDVRVAGRPLDPEQPDETLIDRAAQAVRESPAADASLLQRELRISYEQASRLMKELATRGGADGPAPEPDLDPGAPDIRVLGRVEIGGRDVNDVEPGKRNLLPELAAYLHLNPGRTAEEVSRALGGARGPWSPSTRASNMSRLRAWFGRDAAGNVYVPTQGQGRLYTLSGVGCDWDRFQARARRGLARLKTGAEDQGIDDLREALALVRGQPFAGAGPTSYIWAEHLKQEMLSAIVDVVHALGVTLTGRGDAADARTVITRGLDIEPGSELLFRDLIRAEHRAGNAAGIDHATERFLRNLYDLGLEMEPETADLLTRLRAPGRVRQSAASNASQN
ncbi:BTAD domain-containing putative transcriptional regulator [Actinomadura chibensis]|uniref:LysM domain-containing protein n=1 Tax=Actinomadura chibensis TaxID=392828 RepID=A0A5D0NVU5_9ACTN|nr:BTAD domain-containing putative transcriptional regulator [Actinomadura chibensis]TYB48545.1 hypothetical protein FXF69_04985 [Actinomadura chibensis]